MQVEILNPPNFSRSGKIVDVKEAREKGLWYGTFNLWLVGKNPIPGVWYQQRSPKIDFAPNKLDVILARHLDNGETTESAITHEGPEELGIKIDTTKIVPIGRRLNVGIGTDGSTRNTVSDLLLAETNDDLLSSFKPTDDETFAICFCPLGELLKVHADTNYHFNVQAKKFDGTQYEIEVKQDSFPYNWDNYHYKMALLIKRYFAGESPLIY